MISFRFKLPCRGISILPTEFTAEEKKHKSETALGRETEVDAFHHLTTANLVKVIYRSHICYWGSKQLGFVQ